MKERTADMSRRSAPLKDPEITRIERLRETWKAFLSNLLVYLLIAVLALMVFESIYIQILHHPGN
jgi:hypothetical protein